jgi:hypothetical protein
LLSRRCRLGRLGWLDLRYEIFAQINRRNLRAERREPVLRRSGQDQEREAIEQQARD